MEERSRGTGVGRRFEVSREVKRGESESFDEASPSFFDLISITGVDVDVGVGVDFGFSASALTLASSSSFPSFQLP